MIDWMELTLENGRLMHGCRWEIDAPRAVVVLVTGMMETSERYDDFARYLNGLGCSVYCLDHYGQGRNCVNPDELGVWPEDGFQQSIDMIRQEVAHVRREGLPLYLFAHSMGSYITQGYLQQYGGTLDRVALCGSCGKRAVSPVAAAISAHRARIHDRDRYRDQWMDHLMFGGYCRRFSPQRTPFDWLSRNEQNVDLYIADPKCGYVGTSGFYAEFLHGLSRLCRSEELARIPASLPILLISGTDDPSTEYGKGTARLADMYRKYHLNVRLKLYPGLRHELLNETEKDEVYRDVAAFFGLI